MSDLADRVLAFLRTESDGPLKIKELARELHISPKEYPKFRSTIKYLLDQGELVRLKRGRLGLPDQLSIVIGTLSMTRKGTGFVSCDGQEQDILVPSRDTFTAMDGDRVMVRLTGKVQQRQAGVIIKVVERSKKSIVGLYRKGLRFSYVVPDNARIHRDIAVLASESGKAKDGDKVVVELLDWQDPHQNPEGRVVERLGKPTDPGVDMLTVIKSFSLPEEFSAEVLAEAETAAARKSDDEATLRVDLTGECIYTIDPDDAKDHDDAVSIKRITSGYRLGVHIADVSHYIAEGSLLDQEAFSRATSTYLPGMVIPMIPELLSNNICSLKPNRRRLAMSVHIDFDRHGKMKDWKVSNTIIRSRSKLSYEEVQEFFDSGKKTERIARVSDNLLIARELAAKLSKRRFADGSLDFDLAESRIILGQGGEVLDLGHRVRTESHRLVEEFMLAANRAVALTIFRAGEQFLYRVHEKPDKDKLQLFSQMMTNLGHKFPVSPTIRPIQFSRFLDKIKESPEAEFINEIMLRSMKKAVYQTKNIGHFGLAFTHYGHFTSPIRRYPDLFVHRLLRNLTMSGYTVSFAKQVRKVIDQVGLHCSEVERNSEAAERQAIKIKQVAFMTKKLGEEYGGVISGVVPHGFFVRIDNLGVEGMVRVSSIDDDYYSFEERNYRLIGRRSGRSYRLGDHIRVRVIKVDRTRNEIDLSVIDSFAKPRKAISGRTGRKSSPKGRVTRKRRK